MTTLYVGFDSAWTATNSGALVGVVRREDGTLCELGRPLVADYRLAEETILGWQADVSPGATTILLDQPTIVANATGQRPVENLAAAPVSRRYGGMQPANTGRRDMFGEGAPVWPFLSRFGGPADPASLPAASAVLETYPVLALIALEWTLPDRRPTGRLPKYNPARRKTFDPADWQHVCERAAVELRRLGLADAPAWLDEASRKASPRKQDQDCLDAYLCLIVALRMGEGSDCLMVGDLGSGYIVVPHGETLQRELEDRCRETGRDPGRWVKRFCVGDRGVG